MKHSVLLDTSFFIRLLNYQDPLHQNARDYFRYFLEKDIAMKISTISVAEYCVRGNINELPLVNLQILPFNLQHATRAGEFAKIGFNARGISLEELHPRAIIPNDTKLFAQADTDKSISYFVTSDGRTSKVLNVLKP